MNKREPPLLEFKDVSLWRGENKRILNRISFTVLAGENVAVLGPNGAGKSSLIKLITREYYPLARKGMSLKILGREVWNIFELRALLGLVSNDLQALCAREVSGEEMVLSGFFGGIGLCNQRVTAQMRKKARQVIEFLEIRSLAKRMMNEMSSGEARRFLIARALVHDPKALILDEPATSLDIHASIIFSDTLRKIARSGISIILVTHNLLDVIPEITRVILLQNGSIFRDGPKEQVLTQANVRRLFRSPVQLQYRNGYYAWHR